MKTKKNPFRVRPIRKSWNEKFWKKGTWRTHHTALFAMVLVLGVAFGFDAAFGADVAQPYFNPPAPLVSPLPPAIDAAAPNTPTGAPTGASTVTPKFSGANIQGYVFNQADGDVQAKDSIFQLYDYTNVWGQLNAINGIVNGGYAGLGIDPYLQGTTLESFSPAVVIDDVIDNRAAGIMDTGGGATLGFVSVWDALQIDPLKASPTLGADSNNRIVLVNNDFGEADIEFNSPNMSPTIWEVGTGKADSPFEFYIENDVGPRLTINEANGTTTVNQDLSVVGSITTSGTIGRYYLVTPLATDTTASTSASGFPTLTSPASYKDVTGSGAGACSAGDFVVSCSALQGNGATGAQYILQGAYPISTTACRAVSKSAGTDSTAPTTLFLYTTCFSPNG